MKRGNVLYLVIGILHRQNRTLITMRYSTKKRSLLDIELWIILISLARNLRYFSHAFIDDSYRELARVTIQFLFSFFPIAYNLLSSLNRPRLETFLAACNRSGIIAFAITFTADLIYDHETPMTSISCRSCNYLFRPYPLFMKNAPINAIYKTEYWTLMIRGEYLTKYSKSNITSTHHVPVLFASI